MSVRTEGGLVIPGQQGNGHVSASGRQIHALNVQLTFWQKVCAALLVLHGGDVVLPDEILNVGAQIEIKPLAGGGCRLRVVRLPKAVCTGCNKEYELPPEAALPVCLCGKPTEWKTSASDEGPLSCDGPPS